MAICLLEIYPYDIFLFLMFLDQPWNFNVGVGLQFFFTYSFTHIYVKTSWRLFLNYLGVGLGFVLGIFWNGYPSYFLYKQGSDKYN